MRRFLALAAAALAYGQDTTSNGCQGPCVVPYGPPISNTTVQGQSGYLVPSNTLALGSSIGTMMASYPFSGWLLANGTIVGQRFGSPATQMYTVGFMCGSALQFTGVSNAISSCSTMNFVYSSPEFCRLNWKTDARCPDVTALPTPPADTVSPAETMTAYPTRDVPPPASTATATSTVKQAAPSAYPTREVPSSDSTATETSTVKQAAPSAYPTRQETAAPTWQAPTMEYSPPPTRPPSTPYSTSEPCPDICIQRNITGVPLASNYSAPIMDHSTDRMSASTSLLKVMPGRYAMVNQLGYSYVGWVIIDGHYHGQKFIGPNGDILFIAFVCMSDMAADSPIAMNVTDDCGSRIMLMSPEFCGIDWFAGNVCGESQTAESTSKPAVESTHPSVTAESTRESAHPSVTAELTARPTLPSEESALPTRRPTPRPTYSALPTRRPTLSSRPTLQFRTPRPEIGTKPITAIASSISIQVRNETLFDNPKNVEAVVKTIVCSLRVDYTSVSVESIAHYRDSIFIRNITVPAKEPSRNMTGSCDVSVSAVVAVRRRLQAAIDTYTLNYAIADPPASVTSLEPATVATLIESSPVLTTSLEIPANSYIAVSASEPALITSEATAGTVAPAPAQANQTTNILLGTLIPIGILLVGSVVAAVVRKRAGNPYAKGEPVISSMSPVLVASATAPAIAHANPMGPEKQTSRRLVAPVKVRRIGS